MNPWTCLSFQEFPVLSGIEPGVGQGSEVLDIFLCPPPYKFCGEMAYCGPWIGLGLVPQVDLETLQPGDQAEAEMESNSERVSPGPCSVRPSALKWE